jgi:hypothetical protein
MVTAARERHHQHHRLDRAPSYAARPRDDRVYLYPGLVADVQFF